MKLSAYRIECERRAYLATGNPMHVWEAYGVARQSQSAIPEWVLQYLDKARLGLIYNVSDAIDDRKGGKDLAAPIARALGLVADGRGTPFDYDTRWWGYGRKVREFVRAGDKLQIARENAANFYGVSTSTVMRGAKLYDKVFPEGEEELTIDEDELPEPSDHVPPCLSSGS